MSWSPLATRCAVLVVALSGLVGVAGVTTMAGAPSTFELVFDGRHVPATFPTNSGVMHVGTFTASAPFCSAGDVSDLSFQGSTSVTRSYTCSDGSGGITVRSTTPILEHDTGGTGTWRILDGRGQYASLRGNGRWTSLYLGGNSADWATLTFRSTSTGIADLDDNAPEIALTRASATKLGRPQGAYLLRIGFSARDKNAVAYRLRVTAAGSPLATKSGTAVSGSVLVSLRIKPPTQTRGVRIEIVGTDPLDNQRTLVRPVKLPRR
jgi:hypothetical protein